MRLWSNLHDAFRSVYAHRLRSLLAILSIAIGICALIVMLSVGRGAQNRVAEQIRSLGANVLIILPGPERGRIGSNGKPVQPVSLTVDDTEAAADAVSTIRYTAPALQLQARLVYGNRNWPTRINGTTANYFAIRDWPILSGRGFTGRDESEARRVALIGATTAEHLFGDVNPIGREVRIRNTPLKIIGMLAPKGLSGSGRDQDDILFVPFRTAELRLGISTRPVAVQPVSYILAKATSDSFVLHAKEALERFLRERNHIPPGEPAGFRVRDPAAAMAVQRHSSGTIGWLLAAVASVSLLVGGLSIMNIMLVSVTDRTREIGLRQAVGALPRDIAALFLTEAVLICVGGGTLGVVWGSALSWAVAKVTDWHFQTSPAVILAALAFATAVGVIFGYYPARRAARMLPSAALRSE